MSHSSGYNTKMAKQLKSALDASSGTRRDWAVQPANKKTVGFASGGRVSVSAHTRGFAMGGKVKCADGGKMKKSKGYAKGGKVQKFAAGGAAKVRKGVATPGGKPVHFKCTSRVGARGGDGKK